MSATATASQSKPATTTVPACVFRRGAGLFGFRVEAVVEIASNPVLTPVPVAPSFIRGVINLRGEIVPVLDIDSSIGATSSSAENVDKRPVIVLQSQFGLLGVNVDRVMSVTAIEVTVASSEVEGTGDASYVREVGQWGDELVTLIDHERLLRDLQAAVRA